MKLAPYLNCMERTYDENHMKKIVAVAIVFMVGVSLGHGQGITLGATGGLNMSTLNLENAQYRPGYQIGGFAGLMITQRLGIHTEIVYSMQQTVVNDQQIQMDYALIPVLLKVNLNKFINIQFGPQYGMFLGTKGDAEMLENQPFKSRNVSFALGLGVDLPMGFSTSLKFANAIDNSFSQVGELSSDVVQLSVAVDLLRLRHQQR